MADLLKYQFSMETMKKEGQGYTFYKHWENMDVILYYSTQQNYQSPPQN